MKIDNCQDPDKYSIINRNGISNKTGSLGDFCQYSFGNEKIWLHKDSVRNTPLKQIGRFKNPRESLIELSDWLVAMGYCEDNAESIGNAVARVLPKEFRAKLVDNNYGKLIIYFSKKGIRVLVLFLENSPQVRYYVVDKGVRISKSLVRYRLINDYNGDCSETVPSSPLDTLGEVYAEIQNKALCQSVEE